MLLFETILLRKMNYLCLCGSEARKVIFLVLDSVIEKLLSMLGTTGVCGSTFSAVNIYTDERHLKI